jgi:hypothetical protein
LDFRKTPSGASEASSEDSDVAGYDRPAAAVVKQTVADEKAVFGAHAP